MLCGCPDQKGQSGEILACVCTPCSAGNLSECSCNKETGCACSEATSCRCPKGTCSCSFCPCSNEEKAVIGVKAAGGCCGKK